MLRYCMSATMHTLMLVTKWAKWDHCFHTWMRSFWLASELSKLKIWASMSQWCLPTGGTAANKSYEANPSDLATRCGCWVHLWVTWSNSNPIKVQKGVKLFTQASGWGGSVVIDLIAALQEEEGRSYHLTFDNLFTSLKLVDVLTEKNIACTGTIRANRLGDRPVREVTHMKKTARGSYDHATDTTSGLTVVRWNDNNIVNVVSNKVGVHPLQTAKRWSRTESKQVTIPQPFMIRHYNSTMGGVDRTDQNIGKYKTVIRCKKWWWPLFSYCLDLSVQQAWHLYRSTNAAKDNPLDLLAIRRGIVRVYLARARPVAPGRPRGFVFLDKRVPSERRCARCKVGLHDKCFQLHHAQWNPRKFHLHCIKHDCDFRMLESHQKASQQTTWKRTRTVLFAYNCYLLGCFLPFSVGNRDQQCAKWKFSGVFACLLQKGLQFISVKVHVCPHPLGLFILWKMESPCPLVPTVPFLGRLVFSL